MNTFSLFVLQIIGYRHIGVRKIKSKTFRKTNILVIQHETSYKSIGLTYKKIKETEKIVIKLYKWRVFNRRPASIECSIVNEFDTNIAFKLRDFLQKKSCSHANR